MGLMDTIEITTKILEIAKTFEMKDAGLAKAMNIGVATVRKNKMTTLNTHKFNQKNLNDLISYVKSEADKLAIFEVD